MRKKGKLEALCTRATRRLEEVSVVISQAAPTLCIQVPMFDTTEAIHRLRKSGCRKGDQAEGAREAESRMDYNLKNHSPNGIETF
jgi:hypothetical protein